MKDIHETIKLPLHAAMTAADELAAEFSLDLYPEGAADLDRLATDIAKLYTDAMGIDERRRDFINKRSVQRAG